MIVIPCRHSMCGSCALNIVDIRRRTCPFCNQPMLRIWPSSFDAVDPTKQARARDLASSARASYDQLKSSKPSSSPTIPSSPIPVPSSPAPSIPSSASLDTSPLSSPVELFSLAIGTSYEQPEPLLRRRLLEEGFHFEQPSSTTPALSPTTTFLLRDPAFPEIPTTTTFTTASTSPQDPFRHLTMWEMSEEGLQGVFFRAPEREERHRRHQGRSAPRSLLYSDSEESKRESTTEEDEEEPSLLSAALAELRQLNDDQRW